MALFLLTSDLVAAGLFYEPDGGICSGRILDVDAVREYRRGVSIDVRIGEEVLQHGSGTAGTGRARVADCPRMDHVGGCRRDGERRHFCQRVLRLRHVDPHLRKRA